MVLDMKLGQGPGRPKVIGDSLSTNGYLIQRQATGNILVQKRRSTGSLMQASGVPKDTVAKLKLLQFGKHSMSNPMQAIQQVEKKVDSAVAVAAATQVATAAATTAASAARNSSRQKSSKNNDLVVVESEKSE